MWNLYQIYTLKFREAYTSSINRKFHHHSYKIVRCDIYATWTKMCVSIWITMLWLMHVFTNTKQYH